MFEKIIDWVFKKWFPSSSKKSRAVPDCYKYSETICQGDECWDVYQLEAYDNVVVLEKKTLLPFKSCNPLKMFKRIGVRTDDGMIKELPSVIPRGQSGLFYDLENEGAVKEMTL